MFCSSCGKELPDSATFCPFCGASVAPRGATDPSPINAPEPDPITSDEPSGQAGARSDAATGTVPPPIAPDAPTAPGNAPRPADDHLAIASLVCGIIGLLFSPSIIVGIVLCIIAVMLARSYTQVGGASVMAKVGKVCGLVGLVCSVLALVLFMTIGCSAFTLIANSASQTTTTRAVQSDDVSDTTSDDTTSTASEPEEIELTEAEQQEMTDELAAYLDPLMAQDEAAVDELADWCNDRFEAVFGYTLDDAGVDAQEFTRWMLEGMSWQVDGIYGYDDGTAAVSVEFTNSYQLDFQTAFEYLIEVYIDRGGDITDEQKVGRVFKAAQEMFYNGDAPGAGYIDTTWQSFAFIKQTDGSYVPDEDDWEYQREQLFDPIRTELMDKVLYDEDFRDITLEIEYPPDKYLGDYLDGII